MIFENRVSLEEYAYLKSRSTYLGDYIALCNVLGDTLMYVDTRDISIAPHLMHNGIWESWVTMAIGRYVKKDMYCLDIGANLGYYSLLMAQLGARVEAFEPNPVMCTLLERSLSVNDYTKRVVISRFALSDSYGSVVLNVPRELQGIASIAFVPDNSYTLECLKCKLDDYLDGEVPDFIKCDVEGADILVWKGMQNTWKSNPKIVLCIECANAVPGVTTGKAELYDAIAETGARIRVINKTGNLMPTSRDTIINSPDLDMLWVTHA